ncbi:MAG: hypothetical protein KGJ13_01060 [Patescibacteria group bacterium]|nr:hypothetical protein [Patescibacteria group bacterium]
MQLTAIELLDPRLAFSKLSDDPDGGEDEDFQPDQEDLDDDEMEDDEMNRPDFDDTKDDGDDEEEPGE